MLQRSCTICNIIEDVLKIPAFVTEKQVDWHQLNIAVKYQQLY